MLLEELKLELVQQHLLLVRQRPPLVLLLDLRLLLMPMVQLEPELQREQLTELVLVLALEML